MYSFSQSTHIYTPVQYSQKEELGWSLRRAHVVSFSQRTQGREILDGRYWKSSTTLTLRNRGNVSRNCAADTDSSFSSPIATLRLASDSFYTAYHHGFLLLA